MPFTSYQEAENWINGLIPFGIKPGLQRMESILRRFDHPQRRLKFIHVAGTNGKGSTCAYLASVLRCSGYDVGTFNSPYISRYTDRIQLNGLDIPDDTVLEIANLLKPIADELSESDLGGPTMFEITTSLAILYFARYAYPDFVVWETGLGGLEDCTNIVMPIVSVITNVGHDHMEILGDSLESVAVQKAGIIKAGIPVVTAVTQPEVLAVIEDTAKRKNCRHYLLGRDFHASLQHMEVNRVTFQYEGPFRSLDELNLTMTGEHQMVNGALAVMTLEVLCQYYAVQVNDDQLYEGLKATRWPGRLELISENPRILIDGAHNPEGAETLAAALESVYQADNIHFMIGMLSTKNHSSYLWHILPIVDTLIVSEPDFRKKMDASELAKLAQSLMAERAEPDLRIIVEPDWKKALDILRQMTGERDLAVVSGTLYMISDVRSWMLYQKTSEKGW